MGCADGGREEEGVPVAGEWLAVGDVSVAVNDANKKELVVIDLFEGKEINRFKLDIKPTEMAVL